MEKGSKSPGAQDVTAVLTERSRRGQGRVKVTVAHRSPISLDTIFPTLSQEVG